MMTPVEETIQSGSVPRITRGNSRPNRGVDESRELDMSLARSRSMTAFVDGEYNLDDEHLLKWLNMVSKGLLDLAKEKPDMVRRRVRRGVPSRYRWTFWQAMSDCRLSEQTPLSFYYETLCEEETRSTPYIQLDVRWTLSDCPDLTEALRLRLYRVLNAYASFNPSLGYRRGMNMVAAALIIVAGEESGVKEEEVFTVFVSLMECWGLAGFYEQGQPLLGMCVELAHTMIEDDAPKLAKHFKKQGVDTASYFEPWFRTLFVDWLPHTVLLMIWDFVFCEGCQELVRFAVSILVYHQEKLLQMKVDELVAFFLEMRTYCPADMVPGLVKAAKGVRVPEQVAEDMEQEHQRAADFEKAGGNWFHYVLGHQSAEPAEATPKHLVADAELKAIFQLSRYFAQLAEEDSPSPPLAAKARVEEDSGAAPPQDFGEQSSKATEGQEPLFCPPPRRSAARNIEVSRALRYIAQLAEGGERCKAAMESALKALLADVDGEVRWAAVFSLGHLDAQAVTHCNEMLKARLEDDDQVVRQAAVTALSKLEPKALVAHADLLVQRLQDKDATVRKDVLEALSKLPPNNLAIHANTLVRQYQIEPDPHVLYAVGSALKCVPSGVLHDAIGPVLRHFEEKVLEDENSKDSLEPLESMMHAPGSDNILHLAAGAGNKTLVSALLRQYKTKLVHTRNGEGSTPLHLAASKGHLVICRMLAEAGALLQAKNEARCTPADLASKAGHEEVVEFLDSKRNFTTTRGGVGDAYLVAMEDKREVSKVEWYTIPLPGMAGHVGAVHSMLAITVGEKDSNHTYVIEKAARVRGEGDDLDLEHYKNGVHVSHWVDVAPNVDTDAMHALSPMDIRNNTGFPDLTMSVLRDMAVDIGPYHVGSCNCHHAALLVFNACSTESKKIPCIPNLLLVHMVNALGSAGIDAVEVNNNVVQPALAAVRDIADRFKRQQSGIADGTS